MALGTRLLKLWNAFASYDATRGTNAQRSIGPSSSNQSQTRTYFSFINDRTIIGSIYNKLATDVAAISLLHIECDELERYKSPIKSGLQDCLKFEPNLDQGPRAFRQDLCMTLLDRGVAAIVAVDTERDPETGSFDVLTMRVAEITDWYPRHVKVRLYDEAIGDRREIILEKSFVAIIQNPFYTVMNQQNSTLQRLVRKLQLLDVVDEASSSGKLDLIIQLPYVVKSEARKTQAENRRAEVELQLTGSKYGIAYTDGTEKITQLNRPAENNLLAQVDRLIALLYSQLGLTEEIMNGSASETAMNNYYTRTIEPILEAISEAIQRALVGKTKYLENERVIYLRQPFKFVPVQHLADIADKFTRNEILTANEIRGFLGIAPSRDPKADELFNSNMPKDAAPSESAQ